MSSILKFSEAAIFLATRSRAGSRPASRMRTTKYVQRQNLLQDRSSNARGYLRAKAEGAGIFGSKTYFARQLADDEFTSGMRSTGVTNVFQQCHDLKI